MVGRNPTPPPPPHLACGLCNKVCKRASRLICCNAQCCWNCGVRQITKVRRCWSCPNVTPVTSDLSQDPELRRKIKVWEEEKKSETILQLPDPVPVKVPESESFVQDKEAVLVTSPRSQPGTKNISSVKSDLVEIRDNENNEDDITFQGITFSDKSGFGSVTTHENLDVKTQHVTQEPVEKPVVAVEEDIPFSEKTEEQLIEETISTLTGHQKLKDQEESPGTRLNTPLEEKEQAHNDEAISSETIALIFDEQSFKEPVKEDKVPLKINLKSGFQKLSGQINVPVILSREEQDLEVFEKPNLSSDPVEPHNLVPEEQAKSLPEAEADDSSLLDTVTPSNFEEDRETETSRQCLDDVVSDFYNSIGENNQCSGDSVFSLKPSFHNESETMGRKRKETESRTIKIVPDDDVSAFDKLNKIKEELDKTKGVTVRRKSEEDVKKPAVKPFEAKPVSNALQGLQFLLKMSKPSSETPVSSTSTSTTAIVSDKVSSLKSEEKPKAEEKFKKSETDLSSRSYRRRSRSRSHSRDRKPKENRDRERPSSKESSSSNRGSRDDSSRRRNSSDTPRRYDHSSTRRDDYSASRNDDHTTSRRDDYSSSKRDDHSSSKREEHPSSRRDAYSTSKRGDHLRHISGERRSSRENRSSDKSNETISDRPSRRKDEYKDRSSNIEARSGERPSRAQDGRSEDRSRERARGKSSRRVDQSRDRNRSRTSSPKKRVELDTRSRFRRESEDSRTHKDGTKKTIDEMMSGTIFQPVKFVKKINRAAVIVDSKVQEESNFLAKQENIEVKVEEKPKVINEDKEEDKPAKVVTKEGPQKEEAEEVQNGKVNKDKTREDDSPSSVKMKDKSPFTSDSHTSPSNAEEKPKLQVQGRARDDTPSRKGQKKPSSAQLQMNSIRKTLTESGPGQSKPREERRKKESNSDPDEIKVLSYKMGKPKCDEHIRIVRKVSNTEGESSSRKRDASSSPDKSRKYVKRLVEKERIVRKVYAVEDIGEDGVSDIKKVIHEKSVKQTATETERPMTPQRRLSPESERKASLEQIKEELERVKNRVSNMNRGKKRDEASAETSKDDIKEESEDDDMASIMKDVKQMEEEVKDISQEVEEEVQNKKEKREKGKKKKRKKDKEKQKERLNLKGKETNSKDLDQDQNLINVKENEITSDNISDPTRKGTSSIEKEKAQPTTKGIEIDAKLAKKILTSILGSNIGKSLNAVIRKEVSKTDSAIEKIKEEMMKKGENDQGKKRKHREKDESEKDVDKAVERAEEPKKSKRLSKHMKAKENFELEVDREDKVTEEKFSKRPRTDSSSEKKVKTRNKSPTRKKSRKEDFDIERKGKKSKKKDRLKDEFVNKESDGSDFERKGKKSKKKDKLKEVFDSDDSDLERKSKKSKKKDKLKEVFDSDDSDLERKSKKSNKKDKDRLKEVVASKKKKKSAKKKERKKKKSKRQKENREADDSDSDMNDSIDDFSDDDGEDNENVSDKIILDTEAPVVAACEEENLEIKEERIIKQLPPSPSLSPVQEEFALELDVNDDDLDFLEMTEKNKVVNETVENFVKDVRKEAEEEARSERVTESGSRSGTTSNAVTDDSDEDEEDLRALLLTQIANPRPRSRSRGGSRGRITWTPPRDARRQISEDKEAVGRQCLNGKMSLEQYSVAYNFPRAFITFEEKQLYFPNLYSSTLLDLDEASESESSCDEDCDILWDERRTTNWVTSRMTDPRFSAVMEHLLRQCRDPRSESPEYYY